MASHHVFTRREYSEPLGLLREVESDGTPDLATALEGGEHEWLEVAVMPADKLTWVIRDGSLVGSAISARPGRSDSSEMGPKRHKASS